jgi:hypothetical protein
MNCFCKRVSGRELIVSKETFDNYVKLKRWFLIKRIFWAIIHSILAFLITLLYYLDIGSDILLSFRYYENGYYFWRFITIFIVAISHFMYTNGMIYIYRKELRYKLNRKEYKGIIWIFIRILFLLEMFNR